MSAPSSHLDDSAHGLMGIIGGHSLGALPGMVIHQRRVERTPFGDPSSPLLFGKLQNTPIVFLARHGSHFTIAPDEVNDMANIYALKMAGVKVVMGISSAIALREDLSNGDFVLPDQLIDTANNRTSRFPRAAHTPHQPLQFSEPYDQQWRQRLSHCAPSHIRVHPQGTYVLTSGHRSETSAERQFFRTIGGMALGATGAQEASLCRDINLPYVSILVIVRQSANHNNHDNPTTPTPLGAIAKNLATWLSGLALD